MAISSFNMFKWNKNRDAPSTPKLGSVSLPDDGALKHPPVLKRSSIKPKAPLGLGGMSMDRRSITPHPTSSKPRRESGSGEQSSRLRTVSLSHKVADEVLKPKKVIDEDSTAHKPSHRSKGGSCDLGRTPSSASPPKSILKGGGTSYPAVIGKPLERPSSQAAGRIGAPVTAPLLHRASTEYHRSRHDSYSGTRHRAFTPEQTPKYMKAYINEVPLKQESVILSWPLAEVTSRKQLPRPPVYFDVGFNPREIANIRISTGGYLPYLAREEREAPVSTHCHVTEMIIICPMLEQWPVIARRSAGLRCIDVFQAMYDTYNVPLTRKELAAIGDNYIQRCMPAFQQRCQDSPGLTLFNERQGMCRVDLLRSKRIYKSLERPPKLGPNWIVHFESPSQH